MIPIRHARADVELVLSLGQQVNVDITERQAELLVRYSEIAVAWNKVVNLTGASTVRQYITDHIVDCLAVVPFLNNGSLIDIGSGAGLPGVVLAIAAPERHVILIEPRRKRARFLNHIKMQLNMEMIDVVCERVENYESSSPVRYIISRAFGTLSEFVVKSAHLMDLQTEMVAMKAEVVDHELLEAEEILGSVRSVHLSVPTYDTRNLVFIKKGDD